MRLGILGAGTAHVITLLLACAAAAQEPPRLALPLACTPGRDCWVANYPDDDPGPGVRDYACGRLSYDGHDGTDFALRDLRAMADGVEVRAAAPGIVGGVRDGVEDRSVREAGRASVRGRECGNGVRLEHAGGWTTQYCHLRRGSVAVRPGAAVAAGALLGKVGLSGATEFPHLHFGVRHGARAVDPFAGAAPGAGCGAAGEALWDAPARAALRYARGVLFNYGAAAEAPSPEAARGGAYRALRIAADAPLLAIWAEAFGAEPGDALELRLEAPDGRVLLEQSARMERAQIRVFHWAARRRAGGAWPPGDYHGKISFFGPEVPPRALSAVEFTVEIR
jgi:hypothetical protein